MSDAPAVDANTGASTGRGARRRLPVVTPLVALFLLVVLVVPVAPVAPVPVVRLASDRPWCLWNPDIPAEAYRVEEFARTHNYSPPPGLRGNSVYRDENKDLLDPLAPYFEYDVYPKTRGQPTPPERVVLSKTAPYASWYTPDHYATFRFMFPPQCLTLPTRRLFP